MESGVRVRLLVSHRLDISEKDKERHRAIDPGVIFLRRISALRASARWPGLPYQLSSRRMPRSAAKRLADGTNYTLIVASHEWTVDLAGTIAEYVAAPIVLRSHNDEVAYMKSLAADAKGVRRLYYLAEGLRLKRVLPRLLRKVRMVAPLSADDGAPYQALGVPTTLIPPVLADLAPPTQSLSRTPPNSAEILFVGSLDAPHAVEGLRWFIRDVLPEITKSRKDSVLVVAGRRAGASLARELSTNASIRFLGEVRDLEAVLSSARVFVNPVFGGSGVNMKVGPPSQRGLPVLTTSVGARGLDAISEGLSIADDSVEFSRRCISLLNNDDEWSRKSFALQRNITKFSSLSAGTAIQKLIATMNTHDNAN